MATRKKTGNKAIGKAVTRAISRVVEVPRPKGKLMLKDLFHGEEFAQVRQAIIKDGVFRNRKTKRDLYVETLKVGPNDDDLEIVAIAAVSRDPGRSDDFLSTIQDYQLNTKSRATTVDMYWNIYENEGLVNNSVNKVAALLSGSGSFRVRAAHKGKARKPEDILAQLLYWWTQHVNTPDPLQPVSGARGLQAVTHEGVRYALVEGSYVGRENWASVDVPGLGKFDLPMTIQTITTSYLEVDKTGQAVGLERFYWKPPRNVINEMVNPTSKDLAPFIKRIISPKMLNELKKTGKVLLDPALLIHVRHRGSARHDFGESMMHASLHGIAFSRSVDQLDLVSMQNLINRLTIVMVGSGDPNSIYAGKETALSRANLMQAMLEEPGPNMTIVWSGDDITVKDVGAHTSVLDLDSRHGIGSDKIKGALGVPEALLSGSMTDGKAAGWAANLGMSAELEELQNGFEQAWRTLGERIATENGFDSLDLVYEFDRTLMVDRVEELNQSRLDYAAGMITIRDYLLVRGKDPEAVFRQRCFERGLNPDDTNLKWVDVFQPPAGLPGATGVPGVTPPGRPPDNQQGNPAQPPKEKKTPITNK